MRDPCPDFGQTGGLPGGGGVKQRGQRAVVQRFGHQGAQGGQVAGGAEVFLFVAVKPAKVIGAKAVGRRPGFQPVACLLYTSRCV